MSEENVDPAILLSIDPTILEAYGLDFARHAALRVADKKIDPIEQALTSDVENATGNRLFALRDCLGLNGGPD